MRLLLSALLIIMLSLSCAEAQTTASAKKKTDRDLRELVGLVHHVRITRELVETTEAEDNGDGWIPSLTIYNRDGFIEEFHAYDDKGNLDYKSVSEFDSSGNKIRETDYNADGKLLRKTLTTYDSEGNAIEVKSYHNPDGSLSNWLRFSYNLEGDMVGHSSLDKDGQVISVTEYVYNQGGKEKQEITSDGKGKPTHRAVYSFSANGEELTLFDSRVILERRYVSETNGKGERTELCYDKSGKLTGRETYTYERDAQGNWIKEVASEWEDKDGILAFKRTKITRRTITYY
jgi:YD repeat-containing protein